MVVALSLYSFNPADPSFNSVGSSKSASNLCGYVGSFLADSMLQVFGLAAWVFVPLLLIWSVAVLKKNNDRSFGLWGGLLALILVACHLGIYFHNQKIFSDQVMISGWLGFFLSGTILKALNFVGSQVVLWSITFGLVYWQMSTLELDWVNEFRKNINTKIKLLFAKTKTLKVDKPLASSSKSFFEKEKINTTPPTEIKKESGPLFPLKKVEASIHHPETPKKLITKAVNTDPNWRLPEMSLLEDPPKTRMVVDEKEIQKRAEILTHKLGQFQVDGQVVAARPGPAITLYEFRPEADVKLSRITELADDLALALSSESLRIQAPIPGRDVVGIETSNQHRETIFLKELLADPQFWKEDFRLPIALGKQATGESKIVDLRKMPHLLVAGSTGSGKSVFTVSLISGLIYKHSPSTLRLILVDPKQVDLAAFSNLPHLMMPIVTESKKAVLALRWAVREMDKRYESMKIFGARGIESFNEIVKDLTSEQIKEHEQKSAMAVRPYYFSPQPYIVIVVEEFGDLMAVDKAGVEDLIVRLAQMARASGIHLVLCMQSPRKEVVTGLIKTNIPGRISFKVASKMDSRVILDEGGAERLLSQGDMLFLAPGVSKAARHHGPFLKDQEVHKIVGHWTEQGEPQFATTLEAMSADGDHRPELNADSEDDLTDIRYEEIREWTLQQNEISASLIQRRFRLGYPRAARLIEIFERDQIVGPPNGSKPRIVLKSGTLEA